jgi:hypothetical protein
MRFSMRHFFLILLVVLALSAMASSFLFAILVLSTEPLAVHNYHYGNDHHIDCEWDPGYIKGYPVPAPLRRLIASVECRTTVQYSMHDIEAWVAEVDALAARVEAFNAKSEVLFAKVEANLAKSRAMRSKIEAGAEL